MKVSKKTILLIILFVCLFLFITIPIPYYILQTGETDPVHSYISVDNGYKNDGELTFVTVTLKRATPIQYLWEKISTDREVQPIDEIHANDLTEKEHLHAIQKILKSSLEMAKASAYKEASKRYEIKFNGLKVISTSDQMPYLKFSDLVQKVNDHKVRSLNEFIRTITKIEDNVILEIVRSGGVIKEKVPIECIQNFLLKARTDDFFLKTMMLYQ